MKRSAWIRQEMRRIAEAHGWTNKGQGAWSELMQPGMPKSRRRVKISVQRLHPIGDGSCSPGELHVAIDRRLHQWEGHVTPTITRRGMNPEQAELAYITAYLEQREDIEV